MKKFNLKIENFDYDILMHKNIDDMTVVERMAYVYETFVLKLEADGFDAFYLDDDGKYAEEVENICEAYGYKELKECLHKINSLFKGHIPQDEDERDNEIDKIENFTDICWQCYDKVKNLKKVNLIIENSINDIYKLKLSEIKKFTKEEAINKYKYYCELNSKTVSNVDYVIGNKCETILYNIYENCLKEDRKSIIKLIKQLINDKNKYLNFYGYILCFKSNYRKRMAIKKIKKLEKTEKGMFGLRCHTFLRYHNIKIK